MKLSATLFLATIIVATSCSTINRIAEKLPAFPLTSAKDTMRTPLVSKGSVSRGKKKKSTVLNMSQDVNSVTDNVKEKIFDPLEAFEQLSGEWMIQDIAGESVTGYDRQPLITFDALSRRVYVFDGCDYYSAKACIDDMGCISFNNLLYTKNNCSALPWSDFLSVKLPVASGYNIRTEGNTDCLSVADRGGKVIFTALRHRSDAVNGFWEVVSINRQALNGLHPAIVIDIPERHIHGDTGCNIFNGDIVQSIQPSMSLQFYGMEVSKHPCDNTDVERALMIALELTEKCRVVSPTEVILLDGTGNEMIRLQRQ